MPVTGLLPPSGFHDGSGAIGRNARLAMRSPAWITSCVGVFNRAMAWAYAYPSSSTSWKKTMHVVHTIAAPPNHGRICFARTGWIRNSRKALTKIVAACNGISARLYTALEEVEHLVGVAADIGLLDHARDAPVLVDDEGHAVGHSRRGFEHRDDAAAAEHPVGAAHAAVAIGEQ